MSEERGRPLPDRPLAIMHWQGKRPTIVAGVPGMDLTFMTDNVDLMLGVEGTFLPDVPVKPRGRKLEAFTIVSKPIKRPFYVGDTPQPDDFR
jgi:hypothetical protein